MIYEWILLVMANIVYMYVMLQTCTQYPESLNWCLDMYILPRIPTNVVCMLSSFGMFMTLVYLNRGTEQRLKLVLILLNMGLLMICNMRVTRQNFGGVYNFGFFLACTVALSILLITKGIKYAKRSYGVTCGQISICAAAVAVVWALVAYYRFRQSIKCNWREGMSQDLMFQDPRPQNDYCIFPEPKQCFEQYVDGLQDFSSYL
jgi:hypothetical protein